MTTKKESVTTFRARFTGICAYIPDVEFGDVAKPPKKVSLIMPDARLRMDGTGQWALDKTPIRPHAPMIEFDPSYLVGEGESSGVKLRWFFERRRISFRIEERKSVRGKGVNDFSVVQGLKGKSLASPEVKRDFNWGMHIRDIANFSNKLVVDPKLLDDSQSKGRVVGRVIFEENGELSSHGLDVSTAFQFAAQLKGGFQAGPLSEQVALEFRDTDRVTLVAEHLDGSEKTVEYEFDTSEVREGGEPVDVFIGNLCCDNIMPRYDDNSAPLQGSDEDFRWYYELFDAKSRKRIVAGLKGMSLPIPFPVQTGGGGTGLKPVQCMRLSLHAMSL